MVNIQVSLKKVSTGSFLRYLSVHIQCRTASNPPFLQLPQLSPLRSQHTAMRHHWDVSLNTSPCKCTSCRSLSHSNEDMLKLQYQSPPRRQQKFPAVKKTNWNRALELSRPRGNRFPKAISFPLWGLQYACYHRLRMPSSPWVWQTLSKTLQSHVKAQLLSSCKLDWIYGANMPRDSTE